MNKFINVAYLINVPMTALCLMGVVKCVADYASGGEHQFRCIPYSRRCPRIRMLSARLPTTMLWGLFRCSQAVRELIQWIIT